MSEESRPRGPWCAQHGCHPDKCFEIHYPDASKETRSEEELRYEILKKSIDKQKENIRRERSKMDRNVVDAREQFKERKRRGA